MSQCCDVVRENPALEIRRQSDLALDVLYTATEQYFGNAADIAQRAHGRSATLSQSQTRKGKDGATSRNAEIDLGLPPLVLEYELDETNQDLGSGLKRYVHRSTRLPRAVLSIRKLMVPEDVTAADIRKQLELLCKLDHPNIVPFRECCEDDRYFHLVYDWCSGGLLIHQLWKYEGILGEVHIAQMMRELLSALAAAHQFGVHHLDLSLLQFFLGYDDRLSPVKLFALGLAGYLYPSVNTRQRSRSNKYYYASPEMFAAGKIKALPPPTRHACDVWSLGTILFTLCAGRPPFGTGSYKQVSSKVQKTTWTFGVEFGQYTPQLKDLIETILVVPWMKRPDAQATLELPWLLKTQTLKVSGGKVASVAFSKLNQFAQQDHVNQTVARLLADLGLGTDAYTDLEAKFNEMDLNGDGTLTMGELKEVAAAMPGITPEDLDKIIAKLDRNGNCSVDISEFVAALVMEQDTADEKLIQKAFGKMDKNGDARITKAELFTILRQYSGTLETDEVSAFVGNNDDDGDQKIDYREFCGLFPQIQDKNAQIDSRMVAVRASIDGSQKYLLKFREGAQVWFDKLTKSQYKLEWACGARKIDVNSAIGTLWSYEKGHFTELDIQHMVTNALHEVQDVPGRRLSKAEKKALEKKDVKADRKEKFTQMKKGRNSMMGIGILAAQKADAKDSAQAKNQEGYDSARQTDSARRVTRQAIFNESAVDRNSAEYRPEYEIFDNLYRLFKAKSEWHFEPPLKKALEDMRESCVEEMIDVVISKRSQLTQLRQMIDENCRIVDEIRLGDDDSKIHKGSLLLPKKSLKDRKLQTQEQFDEIEQLHLPAHFLFSYAKGEITAQRVKHMQITHLEVLRRVGRHLGQVVKSCEQFFEETATDIEAFCTVENRMPSPPPVTHLYLKYCEGRELAEDARTPRIEEIEEAEAEELQQAAARHSCASFNPNESKFGQAMHAGSMTNVRLDKNTVLANVQRGKTAKAEGGGARRRPSAAGSAMNLGSLMSMEM